MLGGSSVPVLGSPVIVRARVELAGLEPSEVDVQVVLGKVSNDSDELKDIVSSPMNYAGNGNYEAEVPLPHAGALGYTVRVLPRHGLLATPAELGRVVLAS